MPLRKQRLMYLNGLRAIHSFECGQCTHNFAIKVSSNDTSLKIMIKDLCQFMHVYVYLTTYIPMILLLEIITHPQDKLVSVNSVVNLRCTSSLSSNVTFSWTHNEISVINQSSSTTGGTSILTITNMRDSDVGSYVCTVSSGTVSVMSNTATLTVFGKLSI